MRKQWFHLGVVRILLGLQVIALEGMDLGIIALGIMALGIIILGIITLGVIALEVVILGLGDMQITFDLLKSYQSHLLRDLMHWPSEISIPQLFYAILRVKAKVDKDSQESK